LITLINILGGEIEGDNLKFNVFLSFFVGEKKMDGGDKK
jgi:hypothetical protein